jgi:hypothetical protein
LKLDCLSKLSVRAVDLRDLISSEALEVLNRFHETLIAHEEQFEHAAYVVGLQAGTGHLTLATRLMSERHGEASLGPLERTSG